MIAQIRAKVPREGAATTRHDGTKRCVYRTPDGGGCAVGAFLQEGEYSYGMEGKAIGTILRDDFPHLRASMPLDEDGLALLQGVHDGAVLNHDPANVTEELVSWIEDNVEDVVEGLVFDPAEDRVTTVKAVVDEAIAITVKELADAE